MLCHAEHNECAKRYWHQQLVTERIFLASLSKAPQQLYCLCGHCAQPTLLSHENWLLDLILQRTYLCPTIKNEQTSKKPIKAWFSIDFATVSRLHLPSCPKAQRSKQSTGSWLCRWCHTAGHPGWTTLWKHTYQTGHLISSPSVQLRKDDCHLRGCGRMCLAEGDAIPEHWGSCLSPPTEQ